MSLTARRHAYASDEHERKNDQHDRDDQQELENEFQSQEDGENDVLNACHPGGCPEMIMCPSRGFA